MKLKRGSKSLSILLLSKVSFNLFAHWSITPANSNGEEKEIDINDTRKNSNISFGLTLFFAADSLWVWKQSTSNLPIRCNFSIMTLLLPNLWQQNFPSYRIKGETATWCNWVKNRTHSIYPVQFDLKSYSCRKFSFQH